MSETTYEEATRCPKCRQPGVVIKKQAVPREAKLPAGTMMHTIKCEGNQLCPWYGTTWLVQVNKDGSVPPPTNHTGSKKVYDGFEGHDEEVRRIKENLDLLEQLTRNPGGEVR